MALRKLAPAPPAREVAAWIEGWCELWGVTDLAPQVKVEISSRMTRSLGRCYPERKLIRIARFVAEGRDELFQEVLCHEVAHLAAYELHGHSIRPHGREWKALMVKAGYEPKVKLGGTPHRPIQRRGRSKSALDRLLGASRRVSLTGALAAALKGRRA